MAQALTLPSIFKAVSKTLSENEAALNEADTYNHNHGSNMAKSFHDSFQSCSQKERLAGFRPACLCQREVLKDSSSGSARFYAQAARKRLPEIPG